MQSDKYMDAFCKVPRFGTTGMCFFFAGSECSNHPAAVGVCVDSNTVSIVAESHTSAHGSQSLVLEMNGFRVRGLLAFLELGIGGAIELRGQSFQNEGAHKVSFFGLPSNSNPKAAKQAHHTNRPTNLGGSLPKGSKAPGSCNMLGFRLGRRDEPKRLFELKEAG